MKTFLVVLVLLAIGGAIAWVGYSQTQTQEITCGGDVMSPGDICNSSDGTSTNFEEEKASQQSAGWIGVGIGGLVVVLGVLGAVNAVVRRGRPAAATG